MSPSRIPYFGGKCGPIIKLIKLPKTLFESSIRVCLGNLKRSIDKCLWIVMTLLNSINFGLLPLTSALKLKWRNVKSVVNLMYWIARSRLLCFLLPVEPCLTISLMNISCVFHGAQSSCGGSWLGLNVWPGRLGFKITIVMSHLLNFTLIFNLQQDLAHLGMFHLRSSVTRLGSHCIFWTMWIFGLMLVRSNFLFNVKRGRGPWRGSLRTHRRVSFLRTSNDVHCLWPLWVAVRGTKVLTWDRD